MKNENSLIQKVTITTYKVKCLCGKIIQGNSIEKLEKSWENHIFDYKCDYKDRQAITDFEEKLYEDLKKQK